ncbi:hypothetical protein [Constantimarinum furrinae]|uniref:Uncharacterized protein n=1 Tax=Constantimarinum furrinae TaxID=2562285 RepID=A0A7G8PUE4_9FLAO|nr:hypothetical protein [Constantimarinum furrinae]QNJ97960.1 hypothetical protein ALE3EI_1398 [Constantimarinum furrinae]
MEKGIITGLLILFTLTVTAQKGDVLVGKWKSLSGLERFDLEFDYSEVTVDDFETEEDYINQKMKDKNEDEPGEGEIWRKRYFADREAHYEPKFIESFNKRGDWKVSKDFDDSEYILKVNTLLLYHGWNVGVMRKAARIDAVIEIFKRGKDTPLFKVKYENVKGADAMGYDYAIHSRVAEGYAKLAKSFLKEVKKKA